MTATDINTVLRALRADVAHRKQAIARHQDAVAELEAANVEDAASIIIAEELAARAAADPEVFAGHGGSDMAVAVMIDDIYRAGSDSPLAAGTGVSQ